MFEKIPHNTGPEDSLVMDTEEIPEIQDSRLKKIEEVDATKEKTPEQESNKMSFSEARAQVEKELKDHTLEDVTDPFEIAMILQLLVACINEGGIEHFLSTHHGGVYRTIYAADADVYIKLYKEEGPEAVVKLLSKKLYGEKST